MSSPGQKEMDSLDSLQDARQNTGYKVIGTITGAEDDVSKLSQLQLALAPTRSLVEYALGAAGKVDIFTLSVVTQGAYLRAEGIPLRETIVRAISCSFPGNVTIRYTPVQVQVQVQKPETYDARSWDY